MPCALRTSHRAVLWRVEHVGGRVAKVPFRVSQPGVRASVSDPRTWGGMQDACAAVGRGEADGVGVVLGDGLAGVDLDHVRDARTGIVAAEAMAIVEQLDSYTELSPSGEGLHVLVHGTLPAGGRRRPLVIEAFPAAGIEMYDGGRFFTVTGQHVAGTPDTIAERTAELALVHARFLSAPEAPQRVSRRRAAPASVPPIAISLDADDEALLVRAASARNGDKFARLWRGDTSGYPSHSEADLALANMLVFWTRGDLGWADRLFRASGLAREKWDEARGTTRYGERVLAAASETLLPSRESESAS